MNLITLIAALCILGMGYFMGLSTSLTAQKSALLSRDAVLCFEDRESLHSLGGAQ